MRVLTSEQIVREHLWPNMKPEKVALLRAMLSDGRNGGEVAAVAQLSEFLGYEDSVIFGVVKEVRRHFAHANSDVWYLPQSYVDVHRELENKSPSVAVASEYAGLVQASMRSFSGVCSRHAERSLFNACAIVFNASELPFPRESYQEPQRRLPGLLSGK